MEIGEESVLCQREEQLGCKRKKLDLSQSYTNHLSLLTFKNV